MIPSVLSPQASNAEVADRFDQIADILEIKGESFFRVRAYHRAAESVRNLHVPLRQLWEKEQLTAVQGIGTTIAAHLDELFSTGEVKQFEKLFAKIPAGMFTLLSLPGIGVKTAYTLATKFELDDPSITLKRVAELARAGEIRKLPRFGEKSEAQILEAVTQHVEQERRYFLTEARAVADAVLEYLRGFPEVKEAVALGSLRRSSPTIGDVDVAVLTSDPELVMERVRQYPGVHQLLVSGDKMTRFIAAAGMQVDIKTQDQAGWGSMLQHYTGSRQHNIALRTIAKEKGWSLSEHGMTKDGKLLRYASEADLYHDLGLAYIPPELREDRGEILAAKKKALPDLINLKQIKGDLHMHLKLDFPSSHDLGASTLDEMLTRAVALGYEYIGVTDHNPKYTRLSENERLQAVKQRNEDIDAAVKLFRQEHGSSPRVFKGMEVDILPDGQLALEDVSLAELEYAIVSIHSQFSLGKEEMTRRVLRALSHAKVRAWAHPSARSLLKRPEIEVDWDTIFEYCAAHNKLIEVNSAPKRLDLPDGLIKRAIAKGVTLLIDTDAHHVDGMLQMPYGVAMARRGWAEAKNVANTLPLEQFSELLM